MSLSNPSNAATASMEHIYERLCWLYATFRSTFVYDAIGQPYPLLAKIPHPELFNEMIDYKQNEVVQELQMKDVLCTRKAVDMISVIAKDKCLSAASVSCRQSFQRIHLRQAMKSGTLGTEYLRRYLCNSTRYSPAQFSNFSGMQSSFEMCLP